MIKNNVAAHTPTPWNFRNGSIVTPHGFKLLLNGVSLPNGNHPNDDEATANAKLIVRTVNCHRDLLEACREAKLQIQYLHEKFKETGTGNATLSRLETAIQKAEERP